MTRRYCDICGQEKKIVPNNVSMDGGQTKTVDVCMDCLDNLLKLRNEADGRYVKLKGGDPNRVFLPTYVNAANELKDYDATVDISYIDNDGKVKTETYVQVVGMTVELRDHCTGGIECYKIPWMKGWTAKDIEWDTENNGEEVNVDLPNEIPLPPGLTNLDDISDYLSNVTGFFHHGYRLVK